LSPYYQINQSIEKNIHPGCESIEIPSWKIVILGVRTIAESLAIMSLLCEHYYDKQALYGPVGSLKKATIDSYMHWHHTGTRKLTTEMSPFLRPDLDTMNIVKDRIRIMDTLRDLEESWFANVASTPDDLYLAVGRSTRPSIADLLAYEDVAQLTLLGLLLESILQSDHPQIHAWLKRMEKVPFNDEIYQAMTTLDDVTIETDVPFPKCLGAANFKF